jgi:hypothetical protein
MERPVDIRRTGRLDLVLRRNCDRPGRLDTEESRRVMRHAEPPSVRRLPGAMPPLATWGRLISPSSSPLVTPPMLSSAVVTAETISAITAIADDEGRLTQLVVAAEKPHDGARSMSSSEHAPTVTRRRFASAGMMLTTPQPAAVKNPAFSADRGHPDPLDGLAQGLEQRVERGLGRPAGPVDGGIHERGTWQPSCRGRDLDASASGRATWAKPVVPHGMSAVRRACQSERRRRPGPSTGSARMSWSGGRRRWSASRRSPGSSGPANSHRTRPPTREHVSRRRRRDGPSDLRAADSLQLAAALVFADGEPRHVPVVCLDARLSAAARREGFTVVEP